MKDNRLERVLNTLSYLKGLLLENDLLTNDIRNNIDDAIYELNDVDEGLKLVDDFFKKIKTL